MSQDDISSWLRGIRNEVEKMIRRGGYDTSSNHVRDRAPMSPSVPRALESLYEVCDGMSLADVHIGYFIDSSRRLLTAGTRGEPIRVANSNTFDIQVFGSDGGGGRFALRLDDGSVYYLPSSGAVRDGTYLQDSMATPTRVAATVPEFVRRIGEDVEAFVENRSGHKWLPQE